jgi:hypothetical protein
MPKIYYKNSLGENIYKNSITYYYWYDATDEGWILDTYDPKEEGILSIRLHRHSPTYRFSEVSLTPAGALILFFDFIKKYFARINRASGYKIKMNIKE